MDNIQDNLKLALELLLHSESLLPANVKYSATLTLEQAEVRIFEVLRVIQSNDN